MVTKAAKAPKTTKAAAKAPAKAPQATRTIERGLTKKELVDRLHPFAQTGDTPVTKKQVAALLDALAAVLAAELRTTGVVTLPGVATLKRATRPATPAKAGVNPFTRAPMVVAAKPARAALKARFLKAFKAEVP